MYAIFGVAAIVSLQYMTLIAIYLQNTIHMFIFIQH